MRARVIQIFTLAMVAVIAALVWRADRLSADERQAWLQDKTKVQLSDLVPAFAGELRLIAQTLEIALNKSNPVVSEGYALKGTYSKYLMMGRLAPGSGGDRQLALAIYPEQSSIKNWFSGYLTFALKGLSSKDWQGSSTLVIGLVDPQRKPHIAVLQRSSVDGQWMVAAFTADLFQALIDTQKSDVFIPFVVTDRGQVVGHPTPEYVSNLLKNEPAVAAIEQATGTEYVLEYKDSAGQKWIGAFRKIPDTNLYLVANSSLKSVGTERKFNLIQMLLLGVGLALVAGAGVAWFLSTLPLSPPTSNSLVGAGLPSAMPAAPAVSVGNHNLTDKEKTEISSRVAASIAHELRAPLTSVLTHSQLLRGHVDHQGEAALVTIEQEARSGRDLLDKLLNFSGEKSIKVSRTSLNPILEQSVKAVEAKLLRKGIKLIQELGPTFSIDVDPNLLGKALDCILLNSIESMVRVAKKEILLKTQKSENGVEILIEDTGEGMSQESQAKAMDPFFTTKQDFGHIGLGLPMAAGIIRGFGGDLTLKSEPGKGTQVHIILPEPSATNVQSAHPPAPPAAANLSKLTEAPVVELPILMPIAENTEPESAKEPADLFGEKLDQAIQAIDEMDVVEQQEPPEPPKLELKIKPLDEVMPSASSEPSEVHTAKIDKPPKIELKKRSQSLDSMDVIVRKPGENQ